MLPPPAVQDNVYFNSKDETGKRSGDIHKLSNDHFFRDNKKNLLLRKCRLLTYLHLNHNKKVNNAGEMLPCSQMLLCEICLTFGLKERMNLENTEYIPVLSK